MKKKLLVLGLVLLLTVMMFPGCRSADQVTDGFSVVATNFPLYDFAKTVLGDRGSVSLLLSPGQEIHGYEPTPGDIRLIRDCDLFLYIGGESDDWVDSILTSVDKDEKQVLPLMDCVQKYAEEAIGTEDDAEHHDDHGDADEYDEHIWTSPQNAILMVRAIEASLSSLDADHAGEYASRADAFCDDLSRLDADYRDAVNHKTVDTLVFGDRFPFLYLTKAYQLSYDAAFPGCSNETDASPAVVARLIQAVKEKNIPVVLTVELSSGVIADTICAETGAKRMMLHSCHNVSKDEWEAGVTYLSLMNDNLACLKEALRSTAN